LVKGKPWPTDDEQKLTSWFQSGTTELRVLAFSFDGKYTENAIYQKLLDLGLLKEEEDSKHHSSSSFKIKLPDELPSVEETLKTLAGALEALKTSGLEKNDVFRLRTIITGAKVYKDLLSDYINYRGLEAELLELREEYAELSKKSASVPPK
jgi:hypothetical protein